MNKKRYPGNGLNASVSKFILLAIWIAAIVIFYEIGKLLAVALMH